MKGVLGPRSASILVWVKRRPVVRDSIKGYLVVPAWGPQSHVKDSLLWMLATTLLIVWRRLRGQGSQHPFFFFFHYPIGKNSWSSCPWSLWPRLVSHLCFYPHWSLGNLQCLSVFLKHWPAMSSSDTWNSYSTLFYISRACVGFQRFFISHCFIEAVDPPSEVGRREIIAI